MNHLLVAINAKYIHSNLAVYCLRAYAQKRGLQTCLEEFTINQPKDQILQGIYRAKPDSVFFSCYIWNIAYVESLLVDLHTVMPQVSIYLGGPEVSFDGQVWLDQYPFLAGILTGEGEETFTRLLEELESTIAAESMDKIPANTVGQGKLYQAIPIDLSQVPFPYYEIPMEELEHRIIYYESSRGCPFSCSYCLSSVDKQLRFRDLELVKKELQFFLDHKVPQVKFVDRTFNCKKEHAMAIWKFLVEHDTGNTNFHFEVAADLLDQEQLDLMSTMRPGLIQLEIGVQSTNPETIQEIHRKMDFNQVCNIVRKIQSFGNIHQHLDLIAGLPYEGLERFKQSFEDVYALRPDQFQLGFLKVLKGSYMYQHAKEYQCQYHQHAPYEVLCTKWLSYEEVLLLKQVEEMVDIYYNSLQFTTTLPVLESGFAQAFDLYEQMGAFYERMDYDKRSHSRVRRYDILLEFASACNQGTVEKVTAAIDLEKLKYTMTWDLYLRERLKKQPEWAVDIDIQQFDYDNRDPLTYNATVR